jgi:hypothetical protein
MHCIVSLHFFRVSPIVAQHECANRISPQNRPRPARKRQADDCPFQLPRHLGTGERDFAVIGIGITDTAKPKLPPTAGCRPDERIVRIPRNLLVDARSDIPDQA